jgi:hypothetical protein
MDVSQIWRYLLLLIAEEANYCIVCRVECTVCSMMYVDTQIIIMFNWYIIFLMYVLPHSTLQ